MACTPKSRYVGTQVCHPEFNERVIPELNERVIPELNEVVILKNLPVVNLFRISVSTRFFAK